MCLTYRYMHTLSDRTCWSSNFSLCMKGRYRKLRSELGS